LLQQVLEVHRQITSEYTLQDIKTP